MKKLIVIADWASDSLTNQEFRSSVEGFSRDSSKVKVSFISSTSSTIHTSFLIAQIVETEGRLGIPQDTIIFQNTDPRLENADGADFMVLRLVNGIYLCGPNAGYDFSLVKPKIDQAFLYQGLELESQFRSRDFYARFCAHLMDALQDEMDLEEVNRDHIPTATGSYIGHIDNFGNIKTTLTKEDMLGKYEFGEQVTIVINNIEMTARFVHGLFGGKLGELVIYPGSSGQKNNPYLEISAWDHFTDTPQTGAHVFNNPRPGQEVVIKGL